MYETVFVQMRTGSVKQRSAFLFAQAKCAYLVPIYESMDVPVVN